MSSLPIKEGTLLYFDPSVGVDTLPDIRSGTRTRSEKSEPKSEPN